MNALVALSTIAVAVFAGVQLYRDAQQRKVRRLGAQSRASASAFLLRRRLRRWIGASSDDFETWIRDSQNAKTLAREIELAMDEARRALDEVGELEPNAAEGLRNGFVLLSEGVGALDEYAGTPRPGDERLFDWIGARSYARECMEKAVQSMEGAAIDGRVLDAEQLLRDRREADRPFKKLAEDIVLMAEVESVGEKRARLSRDTPPPSAPG